MDFFVKSTFRIEDRKSCESKNAEKLAFGALFAVAQKAYDQPRTFFELIRSETNRDRVGSGRIGASKKTSNLPSRNVRFRTPKGGA